MIVSRCPVRISLAGGSTDLDAFLQKYGRGSVISFSANIYNYISLKTDRMGLNGLDNKYVIDYMKREVVDSIDDIKNDVARVVLKHFDVSPTTVWFTSDIYTSGSGLASSTSYLIALVNAVQTSLGLNLARRKLCQVSHGLEKIFNPLTGFQDPYGCGLGGFNRIQSQNNGVISIENLDAEFFDNYDSYLIHTGQARSSTEILKTVVPEKCVDLLKMSDLMYESLMNKRYDDVLSIINEGWKIKKQTGKISADSKVSELDALLQSNENVLAHRLLGAGNGGYFLAFTRKNSSVDNLQDIFRARMVKIGVCNQGPTCLQVGNHESE